MTKRILHVTTNVSHFDDESHPTGLWLSELTHSWKVFEERGFEQVIVSPNGGAVPLEPRSLNFLALSSTTKEWLADPERMNLLASTSAPGEVDEADFDAIYFAGGHAVMYDVPTCKPIQDIARDMFERGAIVSSVCHGYCGLLDTKLSDGSYLVSGKNLTGFSWREEQLALVQKLVPYNAEARAIERGASYDTGLLPYLPHVVEDGQLITGQNPASAKATATAVAARL